jgi:hypothetical protein
MTEDDVMPPSNDHSASATPTPPSSVSGGYYHSFAHINQASGVHTVPISSTSSSLFSPPLSVSSMPTPVVPSSISTVNVQLSSPRHHSVTHE